MDKEQILELFRITDEKVAQIETDNAEKIAAIRAQGEEDKRLFEEKIATIRAQGEEDKRQFEEKITTIRAEAEQEKREREIALKRVSQHLGAYTKSVADVAEEYFYRSLVGNTYIGTIHFDQVLKNQKYADREYDIILYNTEYIGLVSVKTNIRPKHISRLVNEDLHALRAFYKTLGAYQKHKLIPIIAGLNYKEEVVEEANQLGVYILTQSKNNQPKLVNDTISPRLL